MASIEPFLRLVGKSPRDAELEELGTYRHVLAGMHLLGHDPIDHVPVPLEPKPAPVAPTPDPEEKKPMNLPSNIQQAVDAKIQAELKPVVEKLLRLKASIDAFSGVAKLDAERRVSNSVLVALGQEAVAEDPKLKVITQDLRDALTIVSELVGLPFVEAQKAGPPRTPLPSVAEAHEEKEWMGLVQPVTAVVPLKAVPDIEAQKREKDKIDEELFQALLEEEEASKKAPVPPASEERVSAPPAAKRVAPRPPTSPEDVAHAKRLVAEVEALKLDIKNQHVSRLEPLLQAMIAEVRLLQARLGPDQAFHHQKVTSLIPLIISLKNESGVEGFVKGLAYNATGDWLNLSWKSRQKVTKYDNDVSRATNATNVVSKGKSKAVPAPKAEEAPMGHQWPMLPHLHKLTKPILLAGGIIIQEKLKSVQERFGLEVEWHEIDHDNPRASQALMSRIRTGKVGAIILLEGVMRHSTYKPVVEACNLNGVPYAMGDKAGVASLHGAFTELERKLAA
jgi:hypothetical protein